MTNPRDILAELQAKLLSEIANNLGHEIYVSQKSQGWGLYASPPVPTRSRHPNNFGYIGWKQEGDNEFPSEPLPHLVVAVKERRAKAAGVTGYRVNPTGDRDGPEARWCVPQNDDRQLKKVAAHLAAVYRLRWPN